MAWYSNKRATTVLDDGDNMQACVYHQTKVVRWGNGTVTLKSGGYESVTTKRRMNEVSEEYRLGFNVFQKDFQWYVKLPSGSVVEFRDGMTFSTSR